MSIEVNPKTTLDLLQRLEAKGVPLKLHENGDVETPTRGQWLIIGCVVEYMQSLGYDFKCELEFKGELAFAVFRHPVTPNGEYSVKPTLLEAVLMAADRALE